MAEGISSLTSDGTGTVTLVEQARTSRDVESPQLVLKLRKPKTSPGADKKVSWTTETVDNEHMDKKKSKCCCIYKKPRVFGESSDDSDDCDDNPDHDCTEHCDGHKKNCYKHTHKDGEKDNQGGMAT